MKVILQKDVENLGKVGDLVKVAPGYARNYLFPRQCAVEATEKRQKEWEHLRRVAEIQKKKAISDRQDLLRHLESLTLTFQRASSEKGKLFGSVTNNDIAAEIKNKGYTVDRKDIHLEEPLKSSGEHKVALKLGDGCEGSLHIVIEETASH